MYIAMNRFKIANNHQDDFITIWKTRKSNLDGVPGFQTFKLLKGPSDEQSTLFVSHSTWDSFEAFNAWVNSESFTKSHTGAKAPAGTYLGHPQFEGFNIILEH